MLLSVLEKFYELLLFFDVRWNLSAAIQFSVSKIAPWQKSIDT